MDPAAGERRFRHKLQGLTCALAGVGVMLSARGRTPEVSSAQELPLLRCVNEFRKIPVLQAVLLIAVVMAFFVATSSPAFAQTPDPAGSGLTWVMKGFNFTSWWYDGYLSPQSTASLGEMAAMGSSWVTIVPTQYMQTYRSNSISPEYGGRSATDAAVARAIDDAHALGLKVLLKPHVDVQDDTWRGDIRPDDPAAWFASYRQFIGGYANLASAHGVEMLAVGTELSSMVGATRYGDWAAVIGQVRSIYSGPITYAASQNDLEVPATVSFSGLLDYLGADLYFPLSDAADPSTAELTRGWTDYNGTYGRYNRVAEIEAWQAYWNKPVIFTEMGFRSVDYSARAPWDFWFDGAYNGELQARAYDAVFHVFGNKPWLKGVFWWNWSPGERGGAGDTDYPVVGKPAGAVVSDWFRNGTDTAPSLAVGLGGVGWKSYSDYRDRLLSVSYSIANSGGLARDVSVLASDSSEGVALAMSLPVRLGDVPRGGVATFDAVYRVPPGTASFQSVTYLSFDNAAGVTLYLPSRPPA